MGGVVAVIIRVMPEAPDADMDIIKAGCEDILKRDGGQNISFEEEDIAFGLKALKVRFAWPEEKDTEIFENAIRDIDGVSSVFVEDYRRAFG